MLKLAGMDDPLLGRPLALYDTVVTPAGEPIGVDVVYLVMGKMTRRLALFHPGQKLDVWGPLGNGFPAFRPSPPGGEMVGVRGSDSLQHASRPSPLAPAAGRGEKMHSHLVMVAGGIGQTPFMALAREALGQRCYGEPLRIPSCLADKVTLCYGARTADYFAGLEEFRHMGIDVRLSTDDGSLGHQGLVTDVLRQVLAESPQASVVCCGPEPMMKAAAELCAHAHAPCQVSLETPMACGIGICFSCVARVRDDAGNWDYQRTCIEGPVFDAARIAWL